MDKSLTNIGKTKKIRKKVEKDASQKSNSPPTRKRCPKGQRRNKAGECESKDANAKDTSAEPKDTSAEPNDTSAEPKQENLERLDKTSPILEESTAKKKRCPKGQRRNKVGDCEPKDVETEPKDVETELKDVETEPKDAETEPKDADKIKAEDQEEKTEEDQDQDEDERVMELSEMNVNDIKIELLLGDIIQINNEDPMYYINYVDHAQMDCIDISEPEIERTFRIDNGYFIPKDEIQNLTIIYKNPLRGFVKQHHFKINTWLEIRFKDDPNPLIAEIINIQDDMIQIRKQGEEVVFFINFKYQGIPKTSNIQDIRTLPEEPDKKAYSTETINVQNTASNKIVVLDESEQQLGEQDLDLDLDLDLDKDKDAKDASLSDSVVSSEQNVVFFGEFPTEIERVSYNRYGINTQVNDILENKLVQLPMAKRTAYAVNKIHQLITRYKQLRQTVSVVDEYGTIYDIVKKSPLDKPLVEYLKKYQNQLYWLYLVSNNKHKEFYKDETDEPDEDDENQNKIHIVSYLTDVQGIQQQPHTNWQELNELMTPFENTASDVEIANTVYSLIQTNDANNNILCPSVRNYITGQKMIIREKNAKIVDSIHIMNNDAIATHSLATLPIHAVNYSRISLPSSSIYTRSVVGENMSYWKYLIQLLAYSTQGENITTVFSTIADSAKQTDPSNLVVSKYEYNVNKIFDKTALYYKSDESQNKDTSWVEYLQSVIPSNKIILRNISNNKESSHILQLPSKLSMMSVLHTLEPFLIYPNNVNYSFMYYTNDKFKNNTVQHVVENQLRQYMYSVNKNQAYFNNVADQLQIVDKDPSIRQFKTNIREVDKFVQELNTDFFVNKSINMVNQTKYLLFSENIKHVLLAIHDKILEKSETVRLNQLKRDNVCRVERFETADEMNESLDKIGGAKKKEMVGDEPVRRKKKDKIVEELIVEEPDVNVEPVVEPNDESVQLLDNMEDVDVVNPDTSYINDEITNFYSLKEKNANTCHKCKKKGKMIFTVTNNLKKNSRVFRIQCGAKTETCSDTVIQTDYMYYTESFMRELRKNIKTIQTEIVVLKNNALFGYETVERVDASFTVLKKNLIENMTLYIHALEHVMSECGDSTKTIDKLNHELNKYVSLLDKESDPQRIISNYVEHIYPIAEKIRTQTYHINHVIVAKPLQQIDNRLVQKHCLNTINEYNINPTPNRASFAHIPKPLKKEKKEKKDKTIKKARKKDATNEDIVKIKKTRKTTAKAEK